MNRKTQDFLDGMAGLRDSYYQRDRELCAIQQYIGKMETDNWQPQKINVGIVQDELVEIDRETMLFLVEHKKEQMREIETRVETIIGDKHNV